VTGAVAWAAFVLALLELLLLVGVVVLAARFWRQVSPQVSPLLAMFTPPAHSPNPTTITGPEPPHPPSPGP
jgi:hypothetical protein